MKTVLNKEKVMAFAKKAFTLIELLVVVAIIGILASVGVYGFSNFTQSGKKRSVTRSENDRREGHTAGIGQRTR